MAADEPLLPAPYRIARVRRETRDVWTLESEPGAGSGAPSFRPGQFHMIYVFGVGEVPISVSGDPVRAETLVHTVRAVGPVSRAITALKRGAMLGIRGPYGSAWPVEHAAGSDLVLVAGGLGLAPLRPAFYHLLAHRERYGKAILLYGTRSPEDILFRRELEEWRRRLDVEIEVTVDHAGADWHGNVGVVTNLIERAGFDPGHTVAMICGPEIMMRFSLAALRDAGVAPANVHLSMERNMKCAIGLCGHCQFGPVFICRDGPVFAADRIGPLLGIREL